ncbi:MAG TPA: hypothetical protein VFV87_17520, partial [Pirellulaceae bacterium]|nr:hypothetical protein [Pirellulaceae bacterium]
AASVLESLAQKLPPSERDFSVFEHVTVDGGTTRSAALEFGISQTRVCQILDRVRAWLDEVLPDCDKAATQRQLDLAVALAGDRLDALYGRAVEAWEISAGKIIRTRTTPMGSQVTTTTTSQGDPRYLAAAGKLANLRSKLATSGVLIRGMAAAGDAEEVLASADYENPPVGQCSGNPAGEAHPAASDADCNVVSPVNEMTSDPITHEEKAARRAFFGPVQELEMSDLAQSALRSKGGPNAAKAARAMA